MSHDSPIADSRPSVIAGAQHTPGPWTARGGGNGPRKPDPDMLDWSSGVDCFAPFTENEHANFERREEQTVAIAKGRTLAEAETNARLIAAAPEMLEILQTICANAKIAPDSDEAWNCAVDIYKVPLDDIEAARAAIAKATGPSDDRTEAKPSTGL